jgi:hypothetical protein
MPILAKRMDENGIAWQLWESRNPNDPLGPRYIVKKYPDATEKLTSWGIGARPREDE